MCVTTKDGVVEELFARVEDALATAAVAAVDEAARFIVTEEYEIEPIGRNQATRKQTIMMTSEPTNIIAVFVDPNSRHHSLMNSSDHRW